jgi:hypothetical protein
MESLRERQRLNIQHMNRVDEGFDVVIICCSSASQANYWQRRLEAGRGVVVPSQAVVVAVDEDWPGGAGNALGTLYAFHKAVKARPEIDGLIRSGRSVGLYHTAGKGTRLAPLPGAENNNKPGVKLPATIPIGGKQTAITILEGVIKQTGCYAKSRRGRLSVFWGDQIFIPTVAVDYEVEYHADILCSLGEMPSEEEWIAKGMDKYGLIAKSTAKEGRSRGAQVEKVSHATAKKLLADLGDIDKVGPSLGSFSVSSSLLFTLLEEFASELASKKGKYDSDPHLWMPMTLSKESYLQIMAQKNVPAEVSGLHFDRIAAMMTRFHSNSANNTLGVFGPVDVGQDLFWWDYGLLSLFQKNTQLVLQNSVEAAMMREFFGINASVFNSFVGNIDFCLKSGAGVDYSCVNSSFIGSGSIENCVLVNVKCNNIRAKNAILINVTADSIDAQDGSIAYNVIDTSAEGVRLEQGQVRVGVFRPDGSCETVRSAMSIDGGKKWEEVVAGNNYTFDQIYQLNSDVDPLALERIIEGKHEEAWAAIAKK